MPTSEPRGAGRPRPRPTIEDVARLAGVSRGTVSRVINGGRNVRPAVLQTVNAAIGALDYSVNQAARNLARGHTGSIAFVISERQERLFEDPNFGLFVRVFSRQLRLSGGCSRAGSRSWCWASRSATRKPSRGWPSTTSRRPAPS